MVLRILFFYLVFTAAFVVAVCSGVLNYHIPTLKWSYDPFLKVERYAYVDTVSADQVVMVGSSLSCELKLNNNYHFSNLSLSGRSALDGLQVVKRSGKLPKLILIEANVFERGRDSTIDYRLFTPVIGWLKREMFFLRMGNKLHFLLPEEMPVTDRVLAAISTYSGLYSAGMNEEYKRAGTNPNEELMKDMIRNKNAAKATVVNDVREMQLGLSNLTSEIEYFKSQGVKVMLLEIPLSFAQQASPRWKIKKELLERLCNTSQITYLQVPDLTGYQEAFESGDGVHLHKQEVLMFEQFLNDALKSYVK